MTAPARLFDFVLFGAAGDLALRKLFPALWRAFAEGQISTDSRFIAAARKIGSEDEFINRVRDSLIKYLGDEWQERYWPAFSRMIQPLVLDINADTGWDELGALLKPQADRARLFYLAIPPDLFEVCCAQLAANQLITAQSRVVVEKPLGYDSASANDINTNIARYFSESQVFRIDHYLGKETVQNLLALRFSNVMFEPLWNAHHIDHVQISIGETVGLEGRASFYDQAGAMRDMVQNHLLQLLCLIAMEPPNKLNADSIRAEKLKVLDALRPISGRAVDTETVRGQYVAGFIGQGGVPAYLEELGSGKSQTETFVAIRAFIDNWRWARVPFYLRTGKRMRKRFAEIVLQFKDVTHRVYDEDAGALQPNRLVIRLQPDEGMRLTLMAKRMDTSNTRLQPVTLNLNFNDSFGAIQSDAYKRLLMDAVNNDASLFIHRREVEGAWAWVDPIIAHWRNSGVAPDPYPAGSWGPEAADLLLARDNRRWLNPYDGV